MIIGKFRTLFEIYYERISMSSNDSNNKKSIFLFSIL